MKIISLALLPVFLFKGLSYTGSNFMHQEDEKALSFKTSPFGPKFQNALVGISIIDIADSKEIYGLNQDFYFVPASLSKILTSFAALNVLGEDFHFDTILQKDGDIDETGVLKGDLWIKASGDPSLEIKDLAEWPSYTGISKIEGKIYLDISSFESIGASPHWNFGDIANYYGAGAYGFNIHRNQYQIVFEPGKFVGDAATVVSIDPPIDHLSFLNEVKTGPVGSGDQACVYGSEYSNVQYYRGSVPLGESRFTIKAAIPHPPLYGAELLKKYLRPQSGYEIVNFPNEKPLETIFIHKSPALKELIKQMNVHSDNLFAEALLKAIGNGSAKHGAEISEKLLSSWNILAQVRDGSGLARNNFITPKGLAFLLVKIAEDPKYFPLVDSFPKPGLPGTLKNFSKVEKAKLFAKTGSMSGVWNLAGYLTLDNGKKYAFTIFCNNYTGPLEEIKKSVEIFLDNFCSSMQ